MEAPSVATPQPQPQQSQPQQQPSPQPHPHSQPAPSDPTIAQSPSETPSPGNTFRSVNGLNGLNGRHNSNGNNAFTSVNGTGTGTWAGPQLTGSAAATTLTPAPAPPLAIQPTTPSIATPSPTSAVPAMANQHHHHLPQQSSMNAPQQPARAFNSDGSNGFPSPRTDHRRNMDRFNEHLASLNQVIRQSVPEAVRRVIRDNWEKALLGSEFHHAFLLNAVIHHTNGTIIQRAIKDFGAKMVSESKHEVIAHFGPEDLDEVSDAILAKASDQFLDKAVERRLKTIDARSLINALARAERLGYENNDVLEVQKEKVATPTPANTIPPRPGPASPPAQTVFRSTPQPPRPSAGPKALQCPMCWRKFDRSKPYEYHVQKQLCTKEPPNANGYPFICEHCGAGFITKVGQQYHIANYVCGDHSTAPATPRAPPTSGSPMNVSGNNSPAQASMPHGPSSQHFPTPSRQPPAPVQHVTTPVRTPSSQHDNDPYAHLTPEMRAMLEEELRQAELSFAPRFKAAEANPDPAQRKLKVDGIQNSFSTKQSIIRKKYGVRLRVRRSKAEIDSEKQRLGTSKHAATPSYADGTPNAKRQRTGDAQAQPGSQAGPSSGVSESINHIAVSDMNSGLGGSSATAAMTDPTMNTSPPNQMPVPTPQNSLSSLQRKGYRVSSHVAQPHGASPAASASGPTKHQSPGNAQRSGSASAPVVLDDDDEDTSDTDTDTDTDGGIPAKLPPSKGSSMTQ